MTRRAWPTQWGPVATGQVSAEEFGLLRRLREPIEIKTLVNRGGKWYYITNGTKAVTERTLVKALEEWLYRESDQGLNIEEAG